MLKKIVFVYYPVAAGVALVLAAALFLFSGGLKSSTDAGMLLFLLAASLFMCLVWSFPFWVALLTLHVLRELLGQGSGRK
ncbi:hypothetical protein ACFST9_02985 [Hymenobacter monticola]|uniref:Uncharacterized protein n=1 Tax=Hymenobacter monticola TaxID=1705399 RepID=A0ABY4B246_9BACT|nr:hypothetical protein [Hymenobacter monticola]UOE33075.1 hypothetical protein MTP16_18340 [Hymenobacter monticola]